MKKVLVLLALVCFQGQAQRVFQLQAVNIDPSDAEQFEMVEKTLLPPLRKKPKKTVKSLIGI